MREPTSTTQQTVSQGALIALGAFGALLAAMGTVGGAALGAYWDEVRLILLDPVKADHLGYSDHTAPRGHCIDRPHGLTPDQTNLMFFAGFIGTALLLAGYLSLAAKAGVLGAAWSGAVVVTGPAAVGFYWHSTAWLTPEHTSDWNPAELVLYHGDVVVTALLGGLFAVSLIFWFRAQRRDLPPDDETPEASLQP